MPGLQKGQDGDDTYFRAGSTNVIYKGEGVSKAVKNKGEKIEFP